MSIDFDKIAEELHAPVNRKFQRRKVYSPIPNYIWSCDLADFSKIKTFNDGYAYVLICVDVFSKFVRAIALRNKTAKSIIEAFQSFKTRDLPKFL